jgi:hypothetical protein
VPREARIQSLHRLILHGQIPDPLEVVGMDSWWPGSHGIAIIRPEISPQHTSVGLQVPHLLRTRRTDPRHFRLDPVEQGVVDIAASMPKN